MPTITPLQKNILIVAGDVSGDLHACSLMRELKKIDPDIKLTAIGGQLMKEQADAFLFDLASQGANGFVEPLKKMPLWMNLMKQIRPYMETQTPAAGIVVVDVRDCDGHLPSEHGDGHPAAVLRGLRCQAEAAQQYRQRDQQMYTDRLFHTVPSLGDIGYRQFIMIREKCHW